MFINITKICDCEGWPKFQVYIIKDFLMKAILMYLVNDRVHTYAFHLAYFHHH